MNLQLNNFILELMVLPYNNRRALGWDTVPIQDNPPCGHLFSPNSFGHTGFHRDDDVGGS
jgi:hypothetical protein